MAERKLHIIVTDVIKPGRDAENARIMHERFIPALKQQLPQFKWKVYRPVVGGKLGLMILMAEIDPEHLVDFDDWIITALEKHWGKEATARDLKSWYDNLDSSEYMAVYEEPNWSNQ
jgi:hypothetical protein